MFIKTLVQSNRRFSISRQKSYKGLIANSTSPLIAGSLLAERHQITHFLGFFPCFKDGSCKARLRLFSHLTEPIESDSKSQVKSVLTEKANSDDLDFKVYSESVPTDQAVFIKSTSNVQIEPISADKVVQFDRSHPHILRLRLVLNNPREKPQGDLVMNIALDILGVPRLFRKVHPEEVEQIMMHVGVKARLGLYELLVNEGIELSRTGYTQMLISYLKTRNSDKAEKLYEQLKSRGIELNQLQYNNLVRVKIQRFRSGDLERILKYFEEMRSKNHEIRFPLYCDIIHKLVELGEYDLARKFCEQMVSEGKAIGDLQFQYTPTKADILNKDSTTLIETIYNLLIRTLIQRDKIQRAGRFYIFYQEKIGNRPNILLLDILIDACIESSQFDLAKRLLYTARSTHSSGHFYARVIEHCVKNDHLREAREMFIQGRETRIHLPRRVYTTLIIGYIDKSLIDDALQIYSYAKLTKIEVGTRTYNAILEEICKNHAAKEVRNMIIDDLKKANKLPNKEIYHTFLKLASAEMDKKAARNLLSDFLKTGFKIEHLTFRHLLQGFADLGDMASANNVFRVMLENRFKPSIEDYNIMLRGYSISGYERLFTVYQGLASSNVVPNVTTYQIMINASFKAGKHLEVFKLFTEMKEKGMKSNIEIFNVILENLVQEADVRTAAEFFFEQRKFNFLKFGPPTYFILVRGALAEKDPQLLWMLYEDMKTLGYHLSARLYDEILKFFASLDDFAKARAILIDVQRLTIKFSDVAGVEEVSKNVYFALHRIRERKIKTQHSVNAKTKKNRANDNPNTTHVGVSSSNNFLAGVVRIFSEYDLSLGGSLACAFCCQIGTPMSLVLGKPYFFKCVSSLRQYGIAFVEQLHDHKGDVFSWSIFKCWKRLDPHGPVPFWFDLSICFLGGGFPSSICFSFLDRHVDSDVCHFHDFGAVCDTLLTIDASCLSVYMDGSLCSLSTVDMKAGAIIFFEDINSGLGVGVSGLISSTLTELQAITLALKCVPSFCSGYLGISSNKHVDALAKNAALSAWQLSHLVSERFLSAGRAMVSGNSRHFMCDVFHSVHHAQWEVGSGSQVVVDSLHVDINWFKFSLVWHLNFHLAAGFTSVYTASCQTYFIKALYYWLLVAVYKRLYDRDYPNVVCLYCSNIEVLDHIFSCPHDAADCAQLLDTYALAWEAFSVLF
ncbi:hypothetical protein G9A89_022223 [Geosiphon pyriformis]|nr:hypothetical protein G9A89_022223 [Geosiphon pyriformis]